MHRTETDAPNQPATHNPSQPATFRNYLGRPGGPAPKRDPMNITQIQDLIKFVAKSGVSEVEIEQKDFKITIKTARREKEVQLITQAAPAVAAPAPAAAAPAPAPAAAAAPAAPAAPAASEDSKYITIKAPMIGTFYRAAGPGKPVFVNVGDEIKPGKTLCIIEAMKLFNEIESEVAGKIVKVLVDDAKPVEYDQPLFLVDPS
jgi:acetyl-CoA carboxylase biotin carboxyl carrier protein